jgi:hypothetical protein
LRQRKDVTAHLGQPRKLAPAGRTSPCSAARGTGRQQYGSPESGARIEHDDDHFDALVKLET